MSKNMHNDGYIILLKGARNEKNQRYYILPVSNEEINRFWTCWTQHIRKPAEKQA